MRYGTATLLNALLIAFCGMTLSANALEPGQVAPKRLCSLGDSMTRAANANLLGDNLYASWVNGYHGFWQRVLGLPDVNSHNQRISAQFGSSGRLNCTAAQNGARVDDMVAQATAIAGAGLGVTYATVALGANDVCRDSPADLPTDAEFETHVRNGLTTLLNGLADGTTLLVVNIPNLRAVYDLGQVKKALGIASCPKVWRLTDSCQAMLSHRNTEADRQYVAERNIGYNRILEEVTAEMAASHPGKFVRFSPAAYQLPFAQEHLSNLDCFHGSWRGQRELSTRTWPF